MKYIYTVVYIITICLLPLVVVYCQSSSATLLTPNPCVEIGVCEKCTASQLKASEYCKETGKRIQIKCTDTNTPTSSTYYDYKSCAITPEDDQIRVVVFQVAMAITGGLSFWAVQARKQSHMSLFDVRKNSKR